MKKLLLLIVPSLLFVLLTACGRNANEIVCELDDDSENFTMIMTAIHEGGIVHTIKYETVWDMSGFSEDERQMMADALQAEVEGETLRLSETFTGEDLDEVTVEDFKTSAQAMGMACN